MNTATATHVGLYVTCLIDLMRPSVGFASVRLLEAAGYQVDVPSTQTCCGQPAFNAGDLDGARKLAHNILNAFERFDYVVVPSGSCAAMLKVHLPQLFSDPGEKQRANAFSERVYELTQFLVVVAKVSQLQTTFNRRVAYHDSCSGKRELHISDEPRQLLRSIDGLLNGLTRNNPRPGKTT